MLRLVFFFVSNGALLVDFGLHFRGVLVAAWNVTVNTFLALLFSVLLAICLFMPFCLQGHDHPTFVFFPPFFGGEFGRFRYWREAPP